MKNSLRVKLTQSEADIINKFKTLETFNDVAELLEIPAKLLHKILIKNKKNNYTAFSIPKKSGNNRIIHSPKKNLSIIQKKLKCILDIEYTFHRNAHGFIQERSIITNAEEHVQKNFVLNFDLQDYFTSINFGRVRSLFLSYYKLNNVVATTLANICCHYNGFLPQGASTSPIIANIISNRLDKNLTRLAKRQNCTYTRYADDITISCSEQFFPKSIAIRESISSPTILSDEVESIVKKNGFSINGEKTRLRSRFENLNVTGVTVNEKLNVQRSYVRYIRAILHSIEMSKNEGNIEKAIKVFNEKYKKKQTKLKSDTDMFDVIRGMISHVGQVRGKNDQLFTKLAIRYNNIVSDLDKPKLIIPSNMLQFQQENTFVIESLNYECKFEDTPFNVGTGQGTSFLLRGIGLITNFHVLKEYIEVIEDGCEVPPISIHRSKYSEEQPKMYGRVLYYNKIKDLAILSVNDLDINKTGLRFSNTINTGQDVKIVGYPNFVEGMDLSIREAKVLGQRTTLLHKGKQEIRFEVSQTIFGGNSGGPIINEFNKVLAVAVKGQGTHPNEVIPIKEVIDVYKNRQSI